MQSATISFTTQNQWLKERERVPIQKIMFNLKWDRCLIRYEKLVSQNDGHRPKPKKRWQVVTKRLCHQESCRHKSVSTAKKQGKKIRASLKRVKTEVQSCYCPLDDDVHQLLLHHTIVLSSHHTCSSPCLFVLNSCVTRVTSSTRLETPQDGDWTIQRRIKRRRPFRMGFVWRHPVVAMASPFHHRLKNPLILIWLSFSSNQTLDHWVSTTSSHLEFSPFLSFLYKSTPKTHDFHINMSDWKATNG